MVLAVGEPWQDGVREPELLATLPSDVRVVTARALPLRWSRRIGVGNIGLRSWPFLLWRGAGLLRREKFDVVFFSNAQFVTFILGPDPGRGGSASPMSSTSRTPGAPTIMSGPARKDPRAAGNTRRRGLLARMLRGMVLQGRAGAVMSVNLPDYLAVDLRARHPSLASVPTAVIGFGASREDFKVAQALAAANPATAGGDGSPPALPIINFVYTGVSRSRFMLHALVALFTGLRRYKDLHPKRAQRLRFHFVGTSYAAPGEGVASVLPVAARCGVGDQVSETPHRVGFLEALRLQQDADALLLPGFKRSRRTRRPRCSPTT